MSADTLPRPGTPAHDAISARERQFCAAYHVARDAGDTSPDLAYGLLKPKEREWIDLYMEMGRNKTAASRAMGTLNGEQDT